MTTATEPVEAFIPIRRVKDGEVVEVELFVAWCPEGQTLAIGEGWSERHQRFKALDGYQVAELTTAERGRLFRVNRSRAAVEKDPERITHYSVLVGPAPGADWCDCRGHESARTREMDCKHTVSLRWLLSEGHL